jgi:hypothetical protein
VYRSIQLVLVGLMAVVFGLSVLSRRFPHVPWLQALRHAFPRLGNEQRARMRRRSDILAGIELILMGIALPLLYVAGTVMFFNNFTTTATTLVLAGSFLSIGLGVTAILRNRRS